MLGYRTIAAPAEAEFVEKKSRFIGQIAPVQTEEEALAFIAEISKKHHSAAHNVYAYILREGNLSRFTDNGEPQGTAGIPTLDVLQKEGLTDVCVVVTRYFGGTLLGTGGLVRAYSHGTKIAVDAARILNMAPCVRVGVDCEYSFYGKLSYFLPDWKAQVESSDFGASVHLELLLREDRLEGFSKGLTELSNGQVCAAELGRFYADMP